MSERKITNLKEQGQHSMAELEVMKALATYREVERVVNRQECSDQERDAVLEHCQTVGISLKKAEKILDSFYSRAYEIALPEIRKRESLERARERERAYWRERFPDGYIPHTWGTAGCFLTTACCEYKGLPDNCYELQSLRSLRDLYLEDQPQGGPLVKLYYQTAPLIVPKLGDKDLRELYATEIEPTVELVSQKRYGQAFEKYLNMMNRLSERYLPERYSEISRVLANPKFQGFPQDLSFR